MTLPNTDSPSITELVSDAIPNTNENLSFLDGLIGKTGYAVKAITPVRYDDWLVGSQTEVITGVGFRPRYIIVFYIGSLGDGGVGFYTSTPAAANYSKARVRHIVGGVYSSDNYVNYVNTTSLFNSITDGAINSMFGSVTETSSDGFTWTWTKTVLGVLSEYCYAVAFCIK